MQAKKLTVVMVAGVAALVGVSPPSGLCGDEELKATFYESCIVREIAACGKKAAMLHSKSENLRRYAREKVQKAAFWTDQKEVLIEKLLEKQIALKDHSIHVFLNSRYHDQIK
jgi:hypothetical protein